MDYSNSAGWPVDDLFNGDSSPPGFGSSGTPAFMTVDFVPAEKHYLNYRPPFPKHRKQQRPNPRRQRRLEKRDRRRTKR